MQLDKAVVVITGGASGLGAGTARYLVEEKGARVALFDLNETDGTSLATELGSDNAIYAAVDVTDEHSVRAGIDAVMDNFGAIHGCINCAGIPAPCKVLDREKKAVALSKFSKVITVNLIGSFNVMSQCVEQMVKNTPQRAEERGAVVNIASGAAYEGQIGQCAYSASKAGIIGLNMPAARELGTHGIRVNAIAPGLFHTPMVDSLGEKVVDSLVEKIEAPRRMGHIEEFAHTCAYLLENAYINAETIRLDAATRMQAR